MTSDKRAFVEETLAGLGADVVSTVQPHSDDPFFFKSRYSAFDHTDLALLLEVRRVLLIGAPTERCLVQTAIDARELRLEVTILREACATVDQEMEGLLFATRSRLSAPSSCAVDVSMPLTPDRERRFGFKASNTTAYAAPYRLTDAAIARSDRQLRTGNFERVRRVPRWQQAR